MSVAPVPGRWTTARSRSGAALAAARTATTAAVQSLPGVAAVACTGVGVYLLAGLGWALLALVPFLLVLDHRAGR